MICECPVGTLPCWAEEVCPDGFGQIQKVGFSALFDEGGNRNAFHGTAESPAVADPITALASWTAKIAATDNTRIVISPYVYNPVADAGAARTYGGGDNTTLSGIEEVIGRDSTPFTAVLRQISQKTVKEMKKLQCFAQLQNLGVYLIDENGQIGAIQDETTPTTYYPIPITSFFVGDKTLGGYEARDSNTIQWAFLPNWSDNLVGVKPDFNPLLMLKNVCTGA